MPATPKDPSTRQRRNITPGARRLRANPRQRIPALPAGRKWRKETRAWWRDLWKSPMGPELEERQDIHQLLILATLVDEFWANPSKELAGEIRLQRRDFGLTVMSRRSLSWEIDRGGAVEPPADRARQTSSGRRSLRSVPDPFDALTG